ncbi:MAG: hypothetical protein HOW97_17975, partial [Catenulispora sp.]|nr:hypothetical protein [Catenulispora sp.]
RRQLSRPAGAGGTPGLIEGLVGVFAELARDGLRVRLDAVDSSVAYHARRPDGERDGVTARRRAALLAATREALRNVLKHSGVAEALLRVEADADGAAAGVPGLTVTVRDFGVGFDPAVHRPGFGLSESVTARMAEVGGTATVRARPGHGTAVVLWVPAAGSAGGRAVRPAGPNLSQDPDPF